MLALILLLHHVAGKETQKDVPITDTITSCPDIGYYFKRDVTLNAIDPGPCQLCFCQDNSTAVCWLRESQRCDPKGYTVAEKNKGENRSRRSPGFADVFFRDAARDVFNRQTPQECQPFESSISEGCPPVDWCIGCTVCDCDANGRWDCHNLSFCPDQKKQVKKKKHYKRNRIVKRQLPKKKITSNTMKKPNKKVEKMSKKKILIKKKPQIKKQNTKQNKKKGNPKGNKKKISKVNKSKKPFQKRKTAPKINKSKIASSKKKIIKGKKPITIKLNKGQSKIVKNVDQKETVQFTKNVLKKVMDSVEKIVNESKNKFIKQKRSMTKNLNKNKKAKAKGVKKFNVWTPTAYKESVQEQVEFRRKREITKDSGDQFEKENITNFLPKIEDIIFAPSIIYNNETVKKERFISNTSNNTNYFKYMVDSKFERNTKEDNKSEKQCNNSQMSLKNNDLETIHENNVTYTNSTVFEPGRNENITTPLIIDISYLVNASLSNMKNKRCGKICQLKKAFRTLIGDIGRRAFRKKKDNTTNKNILSYFRNVYGRFFQANKKNKAPVIKQAVFRKRNILKSLCKNINPCNIDPLNKTLQSKLYQLKIESNKILKSVKIIKGLLKLFGDREFSVIKNNSAIDDNQQNKDILILNAILKDCDLASTFKNLTETELTQIDYIRDNTKMFILSIENFALILNDIMKLLKSDNKQKIPRRMLRCTKKYQNESIKNSIVGEKIQKLKNLLISYNLVQNRFMKGMFNVLNTLDKTKKPDNRKLAKVSDEITKYNESRVFDYQTINIINNLRKLKSLVEKLSFKNRIKRSAMGENEAIDYFLILIKHLLKQNCPVGGPPPVSDGIDLLIEAIKNSADIKPFPKINFKQARKFQALDIDITTESILVPSYSYHKNKMNENVTVRKANKVIKVFETTDEETNSTNMYDYADTYYLKSDSENKDKLSDVTSTTSSIGNARPLAKVYIAKDDNDAINEILGSLGMENNKDKKDYEVFVDETDDEEVILSSTAQSLDVSTEIPVTRSFTKRSEVSSTTIENISKKSFNTVKDFKKSNLKWVEENISGEEITIDVLDVKETTTEMAIQSTRTFKIAADRYLNPISSISREIDDERPEKTMNPEYIMHKKEMNLLNSLDYGTEKSFLESESKEKYNSDTFLFN